MQGPVVVSGILSVVPSLTFEMELGKDPHCWPGAPLCFRGSWRVHGWWVLAERGTEDGSFSLALPAHMLM